MTLITGKKGAKKFLVLVGGLTAGLLPTGFEDKLLAHLDGSDWALAQAQLRTCYMVRAASLSRCAVLSAPCSSTYRHSPRARAAIRARLPRRRRRRHLNARAAPEARTWLHGVDPRGPQHGLPGRRALRQAPRSAGRGHARVEGCRAALAGAPHKSEFAVNPTLPFRSYAHAHNRQLVATHQATGRSDRNGCRRLLCGAAACNNGARSAFATRIHPP